MHASAPDTPLSTSSAPLPSIAWLCALFSVLLLLVGNSAPLYAKARLDPVVRDLALSYGISALESGETKGSVVGDTGTTFTVTAQDPKRIDVNTRMHVLIDKERALSLEQVLEPNRPWETIKRQSPNFGLNHAAFWFRFAIDNTSRHEVERLIELPIPFINDIRLYHLFEGKPIGSYELGNLKPFSHRTVKHQNFVMPVKLQPGSNSIVVRIVSSGTVEAPFTLWESTFFHESNDSEKIVQGIVAGIMLVMIVHNLLLFFTVRDVNYLLYVAFVASYMLFHFSLNGYAYAYLWPEATHWNSFAIATFIAGSCFFLCLFSISFLRLKAASSRIFMLMTGLLAFNFLTAIGSFFIPYEFSLRAAMSLIIPTALTALAIGYWQWWQGQSFARFYCLAWTALILGVSTLTAAKFGLLPTNLATNSAPQFGMLCLVMLLSFTLADRINHDRKLLSQAQTKALSHEIQARQSQQELIQAKDQANKFLEQRVEQRTRDLNATLDRLQLANEQLELLSATDGLTQISNRAYFDKSFATEYRRACRLEKSLSIVMFDIDHFKLINDTYGHIAGDECLRTLTSLVRSRITRAGDILARYGGEEFVILLFDSDLENTLALAEKLRSSIEQIAVEFEQRTIKFTASFGVACIIPDDSIRPQDILASADKALYQAKHAGRNCVRAGFLT